MANPEHLKILKQGVEAWNRWREENPEIRPNLASADLEEAELDGINLLKTNLKRARFCGAKMDYAELGNSNLTYADLGYALLNRASLRLVNAQEAILAGAFLVGVDFRNADLRWANLRKTYLREANFRKADLADADLADANLEATNFKEAHLRGTVLADVDLTGAIGLGSVSHFGNSMFSILTFELTAIGLAKDSARLEEITTFLRGAGVPEDYIAFFRSKIGDRIGFFSCFISYSHENESFARKLHDELQTRGVRCWLDEHDLKPGDRILDVVNDAIGLHDKILLCCSEASLESWWVKDEIRKAMERERHEDRDIIIP